MVYILDIIYVHHNEVEVLFKLLYDSSVNIWLPYDNIVCFGGKTPLFLWSETELLGGNDVRGMKYLYFWNSRRERGPLMTVPQVFSENDYTKYKIQNWLVFEWRTNTWLVLIYMIHNLEINKYELH
jgi:hypothetical protein